MACGAIATTSSESINDDKPWDKFLTEQIAGDEMVGLAVGQNTSPRKWWSC